MPKMAKMPFHAIFKKAMKELEKEKKQASKNPIL